ncbi:hypothetical protein GW17_00024051 [Ensete ventricosum]|nr:hypothetical protein GW17_00024051 [Ensete ventricosum]
MSGCSYKIRSPGWWVPEKVPSTIKLGLTRRVKSGDLLEHRSFFSFWIEVGRENERTRERSWGVTFIPLPNRVDLSDGEQFRTGIRFDGSVGSQRACSKECWVSTIEKRPISSAEVGLRKRLRKVAAEQPADASGSTARTSADKGKGMVELGEGEDPLVSRWSTISTSNPFWTEGPLSGEYLRGALHPTLAKQIHDAGRLVRSQHEKILALRAANKELKDSVGQELAAATERQVKELEAEIERMRTELESLRSQRREFEQEKVVAAYKASRGFESGLEKMGKVSYEFGYRVVLEQLRGKHPDVMIELDPFAKCPEDANIKMDLDQPFDDGTPSE